MWPNLERLDDKKQRDTWPVNGPSPFAHSTDVGGRVRPISSDKTTSHNRPSNGRKGHKKKFLPDSVSGSWSPLWNCAGRAPADTHTHKKIEKILFGSDVICATKSTSYVSPRPRLAWQMECTAMIRSGALPLLFRFNSSRVQIHRWLHLLGVESIDDVDNNIQPFLFPFPRVCVRLHRPELSEPPPFICSILRVRIFCDRSSLNPLGLCSSHLHLFMTRR